MAGFSYTGIVLTNNARAYAFGHLPTVEAALVFLFPLLLTILIPVYLSHLIILARESDTKIANAVETVMNSSSYFDLDDWPFPTPPSKSSVSTSAQASESASLGA